MKHKIIACLASLMLCIVFTGCGEDPELSHFKNSIDDFCEKIANLDKDINNIDASKEKAADELLDYLDELDIVFQSFGRLDFPEEFDYLESIADEASTYMTQAVDSYHEAFRNGSYNPYTADYAGQNYERAYKRVKIIIEFLQGKTPDNEDLTIEYGE